MLYGLVSAAGPPRLPLTLIRANLGNRGFAGKARKRPLQIVPCTSCHRRSRDSNPRYGFPYDGFKDRPGRDVNHEDNGTCGSDAENLASCLALLRPKSPDLALVVESWGALPEPVRSGIVAMVDAAGPC